jgi:demethylmenaquinone methyltransferase/2-methoxy-6-polyprenyl-1,4-benzoquinol methylase
MDDREIDLLLAEQRAYYSEIAAVYELCSIPGWSGEDLDGALVAFGPTGDVLELACGPGSWTVQLAQLAESVTAVDGSTEMLGHARERLKGKPVRFIHADIFDWEPDRLYDVVVFGFWLSHVPPARFESFWDLVARALKPGGRVFFADDAYRTADEAVDEAPWLVRRRLPGARSRTIVKIAGEPEDLERRLDALGWRIAVTRAQGPFFWGEGARA